MLYVLGYTVSTLTGSSSGGYKNFERKSTKRQKIVTYFQSSYIGLIMTQ
jgi:hypothetical protein